MKITYIKFFQVVSIERHLGGDDLVSYCRAVEYDMTMLDGGLVAVSPKGSHKKTIVTLNNVCYMKVSDEPNTKATKGGKAASGAPQEDSKPS